MGAPAWGPGAPVMMGGMMDKIITEIIVTANRVPESDDNGVWLLCFLGRPGEPGTGPHLLDFKPYGESEARARRHIGTRPGWVDETEHITGDYIVIDRYKLAETDEALHGCVGCWYDPETDGMWSIYRERMSE